MKGHLRQQLDFWESNEATCSETDKTVCRRRDGLGAQPGGLEVTRRQGDRERQGASETGTGDGDGEFNVNGVGLHFYTAVVVVFGFFFPFSPFYLPLPLRCAKGSPKTTKVRPHLSLSLVKQVKAKRKKIK